MLETFLRNIFHKKQGYNKVKFTVSCYNVEEIKIKKVAKHKLCH